MSACIVIGGAGFLGSHVADELTRAGHDVTVFDRVTSPHLAPGQKMAVGDVTDPAALARAIDGNDFVVHLAALSDLNAALSRPLETVTQNIGGTVCVLEAARAAGVKRVLFASTIYVFSSQGGFYRCSKQACESYIEEYERHWGLPFTILRYGSLYGPRADARNGFYRLLQQAKVDGRIRYEGRPNDLREYIHVLDAARLTVAALGDEFTNEHLVITGHHPTRIADLFEMFAEILGRHVDVEYQGLEDDGHYRITPYAYRPRMSRKFTSNLYVDMGQGILELLEEPGGRKGRAEST